MVFVIEKIETDEQRAELASLGIKSPFNRKEPARVRKWMVDRDRELYFFSFGQAGPVSDSYVGLADRGGMVLEASGDLDASGPDVPGGIDVRWNMTSITVPRAHATRSEFLLGALDEALHAYGYLGDVEVTRSVAVTLTSAKLV
jgi:hypothetical protein